jgi:hypothetical protein
MWIIAAERCCSVGEDEDKHVKGKKGDIKQDKGEEKEE